MNGDSRPLPKEKRTRSQAARDSTIETHGKRAAVVRAAKDAVRSLSALIAAVDAYEGKPDFSWYGGHVDDAVIRAIVRLKQEGKL